MKNSITGRISFNRSYLHAAVVTLWKAGNPDPIISETIEAGHEFAFPCSPVPDAAVHYLTAEISGTDVSLLSVLTPGFEGSIVINELTTVASAFTCAQFFQGTHLPEISHGLRIASKNTPNLVDPATGSWGKVLINPFNITQNETLGRINTLASLITAFGTVEKDNQSWKESFLDQSIPIGGNRPTNTAEAMIGIANSPWANSAGLFKLFDRAFPQPTDGFPSKPNRKVPESRRDAPFVPYLSFAPEDFAMILAFGDGGICAPGKLSLDKEGNLWTGLNWMPGAQNGVYQGIGGGLVKLSSSGELISPPATGYTGMDVDGAGWGTAVTDQGVCWVTSFNGAIGIYDLKNGKPVDRTIPEKLKIQLRKNGGLQGIGVAPNSDIWITGTSSNVMLHIPEGDPSKGSIVDNDYLNKLLSAPFAATIDKSNRVWISNTNGRSLVRYSPDVDGGFVERFKLAGGGRGVALDSQGNCWVACNTSPDFPATTPTDGVSILEGFALGYPHLQQTLGRNNKTGSVFMIEADAKPDDVKSKHLTPYGDGELNAPWGVSVDGNDDVWVANFMGRGVSFMAGANPSGRTGSNQTGEVIHKINSGSIQMLTDVVVDQAGNLWCANNWNDPQTVMEANPEPRYSTWGGGSGVVVIYGIASPAQTPLIGPASAASSSSDL